MVAVVGGGGKVPRGECSPMAWCCTALHRTGSHSATCRHEARQKDNCLLLEWGVLDQFLDQVDVGQHHSPAAVP
jgi:hypothetical protein